MITNNDILAGNDKNPTPLPNAHAHNDYRHQRPLHDALGYGFCSVEADIHLVGDQLLVAHDADEVNSDQTLEKLYLEPLMKRVQKNKGQVYSIDADFHLLIDIKTEGVRTYRALQPVLKKYREMLTRFSSGQTDRRAVTIIISGNRPRQPMELESDRLAGFDGRMEDLDLGSGPHFIPWISHNWSQVFQWRGQGEFPQSEKLKLKGIVAKTHAKGRRLRFWAVPDQEACWRVLRDGGVDIINTDRLSELSQFLLNQ
ncbi:MAG TPA: hypothetical protein EYQ50_20455 [Verrucomicrobiales bacterium]|nr:hypothetical protein [Verrucomicrobiales bacterium]